MLSATSGGTFGAQNVLERRVEAVGLPTEEATDTFKSLAKRCAAFFAFFATRLAHEKRNFT